MSDDLNASRVTYAVDADDRVVYVNHDWQTFGRANGAPDSLLGEAVLGRSLWEFIHDAETRHLHTVLLGKVRRSAAPLFGLPFRCDAPHLRRYMRMDLIARGQGEVEYRCSIERVEQRPAIASITAPDGAEFLRMCSWCKKVHAGSTSWLEIEDAIAALGLFDAAALPAISHTMCDACLAALNDD